MINILVVEDDFISLEVLKAMLSRYPVQLMSAGSGADALTQVRRCQPDLVFLDYELPDMNGIELKIKIDAACATHRAIMVMVSGHQHPSFVEQCAKHGIEHILTKPVDPEQLTNLLRISGGIE